MWEQIGETHQGLFDLSYLSTIPNMNIMAPKNFEELEMMLEFAVNLNEPAVIRYPRGGEGVPYLETMPIQFGKAEVIKEGKDISIVAIGKMVERAVEISNLLKERGIDSEIINARFLKPLDKELVLNSISKTKRVVTIEDNLLTAGLGSAIIKTINESKLENIKVKSFGYDDTFVRHGKTEELEKVYGLDAESIIKNILD